MNTTERRSSDVEGAAGNHQPATGADPNEASSSRDTAQHHTISPPNSNCVSDTATKHNSSIRNQQTAGEREGREVGSGDGASEQVGGSAGGLVGGSGLALPSGLPALMRAPSPANRPITPSDANNDNNNAVVNNVQPRVVVAAAAGNGVPSLPSGLPALLPTGLPSGLPIGLPSMLPLSARRLRPASGDVNSHAAVLTQQAAADEGLRASAGPSTSPSPAPEAVANDASPLPFRSGTPHHGGNSDVTTPTPLPTDGRAAAAVGSPQTPTVAPRAVEQTTANSFQFAPLPAGTAGSSGSGGGGNGTVLSSTSGHMRAPAVVGIAVGGLPANLAPLRLGEGLRAAPPLQPSSETDAGARSGGGGGEGEGSPPQHYNQYHRFVPGGAPLAYSATCTAAESTSFFDATTTDAVSVQTAKPTTPSAAAGAQCSGAAGGAHHAGGDPTSARPSPTTPTRTATSYAADGGLGQSYSGAIGGYIVGDPQWTAHSTPPSQVSNTVITGAPQPQPHGNASAAPINNGRAAAAASGVGASAGGGPLPISIAAMRRADGAQSESSYAALTTEETTEVVRPTTTTTTFTATTSGGDETKRRVLSVGSGNEAPLAPAARREGGEWTGGVGGGGVGTPAATSVAMSIGSGAAAAPPLRHPMLAAVALSDGSSPTSGRGADGAMLGGDRTAEMPFGGGRIPTAAAALGSEGGGFSSNPLGGPFARSGAGGGGVITAAPPLLTGLDVPRRGGPTINTDVDDGGAPVSRSGTEAEREGEVGRNDDGDSDSSIRREKRRRRKRKGGLFARLRRFVSRRRRGGASDNTSTVGSSSSYRSSNEDDDSYSSSAYRSSSSTCSSSNSGGSGSGNRRRRHGRGGGRRRKRGGLSSGGLRSQQLTSGEAAALLARALPRPDSEADEGRLSGYPSSSYFHDSASALDVPKVGGGGGGYSRGACDDGGACASAFTETNSEFSLSVRLFGGLRRGSKNSNKPTGDGAANPKSGEDEGKEKHNGAGVKRQKPLPESMPALRRYAQHRRIRPSTLLEVEGYEPAAVMRLVRESLAVTPLLEWFRHRPTEQEYLAQSYGVPPPPPQRRAIAVAGAAGATPSQNVGGSHSYHPNAQLADYCCDVCGATAPTSARGPTTSGGVNQQQQQQQRIVAYEYYYSDDDDAIAASLDHTMKTLMRGGGVLGNEAGRSNGGSYGGALSSYASSSHRLGLPPESSAALPQQSALYLMMMILVLVVTLAIVLPAAVDASSSFSAAPTAEAPGPIVMVAFCGVFALCIVLEAIRLLFVSRLLRHRRDDLWRSCAVEGGGDERERRGAADGGQTAAYRCDRCRSANAVSSKEEEGGSSRGAPQLLLCSVCGGEKEATTPPFFNGGGGIGGAEDEDDGASFAGGRFYNADVATAPPAWGAVSADIHSSAAPSSSPVIGPASSALLASPPLAPSEAAPPLLTARACVCPHLPSAVARTAGRGKGGPHHRGGVVLPSGGPHSHPSHPNHQMGTQNGHANSEAHLRGGHAVSTATNGAANANAITTNNDNAMGHANANVGGGWSLRGWWGSSPNNHHHHPHRRRRSPRYYATRLHQMAVLGDAIACLFFLAFGLSFCLRYNADHGEACRTEVWWRRADYAELLKGNGNGSGGPLSEGGAAAVSAHLSNSIGDLLQHKLNQKLLATNSSGSSSAIPPANAAAAAAAAVSAALAQLVVDLPPLLRKLLVRHFFCDNSLTGSFEVAMALVVWLRRPTFFPTFVVSLVLYVSFVLIEVLAPKHRFAAMAGSGDGSDAGFNSSSGFGVDGFGDGPVGTNGEKFYLPQRILLTSLTMWGLLIVRAHMERSERRRFASTRVQLAKIAILKVEHARMHAFLEELVPRIVSQRLQLLGAAAGAGAGAGGVHGRGKALADSEKGGGMMGMWGPNAAESVALLVAMASSSSPTSAVANSNSKLPQSSHSHPADADGPALLRMAATMGGGDNAGSLSFIPPKEGLPSLAAVAALDSRGAGDALLAFLARQYQLNQRHYHYDSSSPAGGGHGFAHSFGGGGGGGGLGGGRYLLPSEVRAAEAALLQRSDFSAEAVVLTIGLLDFVRFSNDNTAPYVAATASGVKASVMRVLMAPDEALREEAAVAAAVGATANGSALPNDISHQATPAANTAATGTAAAAPAPPPPPHRPPPLLLSVAPQFVANYGDHIVAVYGLAWGMVANPSHPLAPPSVLIRPPLPKRKKREGGKRGEKEKDGKERGKKEKGEKGRPSSLTKHSGTALTSPAGRSLNGAAGSSCASVNLFSNSGGSLVGNSSGGSGGVALPSQRQQQQQQQQQRAERDRYGEESVWLPSVGAIVRSNKAGMPNASGSRALNASSHHSVTPSAAGRSGTTGAKGAAVSGSGVAFFPPRLPSLLGGGGSGRATSPRERGSQYLSLPAPQHHQHLLPQQQHTARHGGGGNAQPSKVVVLDSFGNPVAATTDDDASNANAVGGPPLPNNGGDALQQQQQQAVLIGSYDERSDDEVVVDGRGNGCPNTARGGGDVAIEMAVVGGGAPAVPAAFANAGANACELSLQQQQQLQYSLQHMPSLMSSAVLRMAGSGNSVAAPATDAPPTADANGDVEADDPVALHHRELQEGGLGTANADGAGRAQSKESHHPSEGNSPHAAAPHVEALISLFPHGSLAGGSRGATAAAAGSANNAASALTAGGSSTATSPTNDRQAQQQRGRRGQQQQQQNGAANSELLLPAADGSIVTIYHDQYQPFNSQLQGGRSTDGFGFATSPLHHQQHSRSNSGRFPQQQRNSALLRAQLQSMKEAHAKRLASLSFADLASASAEARGTYAACFRRHVLRAVALGACRALAELVGLDAASTQREQTAVKAQWRAARAAGLYLGNNVNDPMFGVNGAEAHRSHQRPSFGQHDTNSNGSGASAAGVAAAGGGGGTASSGGGSNSTPRTAAGATLRSSYIAPPPNTTAPRLSFSLHCGPVVGTIPGLSTSSWRYAVTGEGVSVASALHAATSAERRILVSEEALGALGPIVMDVADRAAPTVIYCAPLSSTHKGIATSPSKRQKGGVFYAAGNQSPRLADGSRANSPQFGGGTDAFGRHVDNNNETNAADFPPHSSSHQSQLGPSSHLGSPFTLRGAVMGGFGGGGGGLGASSRGQAVASFADRSAAPTPFSPTVTDALLTERAADCGAGAGTGVGGAPSSFHHHLHQHQHGLAPAPSPTSHAAQLPGARTPTPAAATAAVPTVVAAGTGAAGGPNSSGAAVRTLAVAATAHHPNIGGGRRQPGSQSQSHPSPPPSSSVNPSAAHSSAPQHLTTIGNIEALKLSAATCLSEGATEHEGAGAGAEVAAEHHHQRGDGGMLLSPRGGADRKHLYMQSSNGPAASHTKRGATSAVSGADGSKSGGVYSSPSSSSSNSSGGRLTPRGARSFALSMSRGGSRRRAEGGGGGDGTAENDANNALNPRNLRSHNNLSNSPNSNGMNLSRSRRHKRRDGDDDGNGDGEGGGAPFSRASSQASSHGAMSGASVRSHSYFVSHSAAAAAGRNRHPNSGASPVGGPSAASNSLAVLVGSSVKKTKAAAANSRASSRAAAVDDGEPTFSPVVPPEAVQWHTKKDGEEDLGERKGSMRREGSRRRYSSHGPPLPPPVQQQQPSPGMPALYASGLATAVSSSPAAVAGGGKQPLSLPLLLPSTSRSVPARGAFFEGCTRPATRAFASVLLDLDYTPEVAIASDMAALGALWLAAERRRLRAERSALRRRVADEERKERDEARTERRRRRLAMEGAAMPPPPPQLNSFSYAHHFQQQQQQHQQYGAYGLGVTYDMGVSHSIPSSSLGGGGGGAQMHVNSADTFFQHGTPTAHHPHHHHHPHAPSSSFGQPQPQQQRSIVGAANSNNNFNASPQQQQSAASAAVGAAAVSGGSLVVPHSAVFGASLSTAPSTAAAAVRATSTTTSNNGDGGAPPPHQQHHQRPTAVTAAPTDGVDGASPPIVDYGHAILTHPSLQPHAAGANANPNPNPSSSEAAVGAAAQHAYITHPEEMPAFSASASGDEGAHGPIAVAAVGANAGAGAGLQHKARRRQQLSILCPPIPQNHPVVDAHLFHQQQQQFQYQHGDAAAALGDGGGTAAVLRSSASHHPLLLHSSVASSSRRPSETIVTSSSSGEESDSGAPLAGPVGKGIGAAAGTSPVAAGPFGPNPNALINRLDPSSVTAASSSAAPTAAAAAALAAAASELAMVRAGVDVVGAFGRAFKALQRFWGFLCRLLGSCCCAFSSSSHHEGGQMRRRGGGQEGKEMANTVVRVGSNASSSHPAAADLISHDDAASRNSSTTAADGDGLYTYGDGDGTEADVTATASTTTVVYYAYEGTRLYTRSQYSTSRMMGQKRKRKKSILCQIGAAMRRLVGAPIVSTIRLMTQPLRFSDPFVEEVAFQRRYVLFGVNVRTFIATEALFLALAALRFAIMLSDLHRVYPRMGLDQYALRLRIPRPVMPSRPPLLPPTPTGDNTTYTAATVATTAFTTVSQFTPIDVFLFAGEMGAEAAHLFKGDSDAFARHTLAIMFFLLVIALSVLTLWLRLRGRQFALAAEAEERAAAAAQQMLSVRSGWGGGFAAAIAEAANANRRRGSNNIPNTSAVVGSDEAAVVSPTTTVHRLSSHTTTTNRSGFHADSPLAIDGGGGKKEKGQRQQRGLRGKRRDSAVRGQRRASSSMRTGGSYDNSYYSGASSSSGSSSTSVRGAVTTTSTARRRRKSGNVCDSTVGDASCCGGGRKGKLSKISSSAQPASTTCSAAAPLDPSCSFLYSGLPRYVLPLLKQLLFFAACFLSQPARSGLDVMGLWVFFIATSFAAGYPLHSRLYTAFALYAVTIFFIVGTVMFEFSALRKSYLAAAVVIVHGTLIALAFADRADRQSFIAVRLRAAHSVALAQQQEARRLVIANAIPRPLAQLFYELKATAAAQRERRREERRRAARLTRRFERWRRREAEARREAAAAEAHAHAHHGGGGGALPSRGLTVPNQQHHNHHNNEVEDEAAARARFIAYESNRAAASGAAPGASDAASSGDGTTSDDSGGGAGGDTNGDTSRGARKYSSDGSKNSRRNRRKQRKKKRKAPTSDDERRKAAAAKLAFEKEDAHNEDLMFACVEVDFNVLIRLRFDDYYEAFSQTDSANGKVFGKDGGGNDGKGSPPLLLSPRRLQQQQTLPAAVVASGTSPEGGGGGGASDGRDGDGFAAGHLSTASDTVRVFALSCTSGGEAEDRRAITPTLTPAAGPPSTSPHSSPFPTQSAPPAVEPTAVTALRDTVVRAAHWALFLRVIDALLATEFPLLAVMEVVAGGGGGGGEVVVGGPWRSGVASRSLAEQLGAFRKAKHRAEAEANCRADAAQRWQEHQAQQFRNRYGAPPSPLSGVGVGGGTTAIDMQSGNNDMQQRQNEAEGDNKENGNKNKRPHPLVSAYPHLFVAQPHGSSRGDYLVEASLFVSRLEEVLCAPAQYPSPPPPPPPRSLTPAAQHQQQQPMTASLEVPPLSPAQSSAGVDRRQQQQKKSHQRRGSRQYGGEEGGRTTPHQQTQQQHRSNSAVGASRANSGGGGNRGDGGGDGGGGNNFFSTISAMLRPSDDRQRRRSKSHHSRRNDRRRQARGDSGSGSSSTLGEDDADETTTNATTANNNNDVLSNATGRTFTTEGNSTTTGGAATGAGAGGPSSAPIAGAAGHANDEAGKKQRGSQRRLHRAPSGAASLPLTSPHDVGGGANEEEGEERQQHRNRRRSSRRRHDSAAKDRDRKKDNNNKHNNTKGTSAAASPQQQKEQQRRPILSNAGHARQVIRSFESGRARILFSAVATADDAIIMLRNSLYPSFDVLGAGPLRARELLRAAGAGTIAFTESFVEAFRDEVCERDRIVQMSGVAVKGKVMVSVGATKGGGVGGASAGGATAAASAANGGGAIQPQQTMMALALSGGAQRVAAARQRVARAHAEAERRLQAHLRPFRIAAAAAAAAAPPPPHSLLLFNSSRDGGARAGDGAAVGYRHAETAVAPTTVPAVHPPLRIFSADATANNTPTPAAATRSSGGGGDGFGEKASPKPFSASPPLLSEQQLQHEQKPFAPPTEQDDEGFTAPPAVSLMFAAGTLTHPGASATAAGGGGGGPTTSPLRAPTAAAANSASSASHSLSLSVSQLSHPSLAGGHFPPSATAANNANGGRPTADATALPPNSTAAAAAFALSSRPLPPHAIRYVPTAAALDAADSYEAGLAGEFLPCSSVFSAPSLQPPPGHHRSSPPLSPAAAAAATEEVVPIVTFGIDPASVVPLPFVSTSSDGRNRNRRRGRAMSPPSNNHNSAPHSWRVRGLAMARMYTFDDWCSSTATANANVHVGASSGGAAAPALGSGEEASVGLPSFPAASGGGGLTTAASHPHGRSRSGTSSQQSKRGATTKNRSSAERRRSDRRD